jgi:hypothetical protein
MKSLPQLKQEANEMQQKHNDAKASKTAESKQMCEMMEKHYMQLSDEIIHVVEEAIRQAEILRVKRAIIGVTANDTHKNSLLTSEIAKPSYPTENDSVMQLVGASLPSGVRLQAKDAAVLQGINLEKEGRAKILLMEPKFPLVDVYIPQHVPISRRARLNEWDGIVLLIEWD